MVDLAIVAFNFGQPALRVALRVSVLFRRSPCSMRLRTINNMQTVERRERESLATLLQKQMPRLSCVDLRLNEMPCAACRMRFRRRTRARARQKVTKSLAHGRIGAIGLSRARQILALARRRRPTDVCAAVRWLLADLSAAHQRKCK